VSALAGLTRLESLTLISNNITDVSVLARLSKLKSIHIGDNKLTDLSPLMGLKRLTFLSVFGNPNLAKTEIEKLKKALPKCRIHHNAKK
jgi:Leucine-rich repeat (LRR) protein